MNDNIKEFLELINENPELPIICMVESEIIGDDYGRWMGQIGWSIVGEFATYNERFYDDREEFIEDYYNSNDEILDERFGYNPRMSYPDAIGEVEYSAINADGTMKSFGETMQDLRKYFEQMTGAEKRYKKEDIEANKAAKAQLDKYLKEVADRAFKKAIIVYIDTPDEIEEFEDENV